MAEKIFKTRIKQRRDTSANWESKNPVLLNGEVIIVDTASGETRTKTGDGNKTYTQLPFDDEGTKGGKSLIDKSFADNVSTSGNTTTIDKQLKTYSITTRLEADVAITGLDENGQEVTRHKLSEKADSADVYTKSEINEVLKNNRPSKSVPIDPSAVSEIIRCGISYFNHKDEFTFTSSGKGTLFDDDFDMSSPKIDCSSLMMAWVMGIPYEYSKYAGKNNSKHYDYGIKLPTNPYATDRSNRYYTHELAHYFDDQGWCFIPDKNYSDIAPGDIIFVSFKSRDGNSDFHDNAYMKIDHCLLVLGYKDSTHLICLHTSETYTLNFYDVCVLPSEYDSTSSNGYNNGIKLVARLPFKPGHISEKPIFIDSDNPVTTTNTTNGFLRTINLETTPLKTNAAYTLIANVENAFAQEKPSTNNYFGIRASYADGTADETIFSWAKNVYPEDGLYRCHFATTDKEIIKLKLYVLSCTVAGHKYKWSALYEGAVSTTPYESDLSRNQSDIVVIDNLESTSTTNSLSANQGRVLNENKVDKATGKSLIDENVAKYITFGGLDSDGAIHIDALTHIADGSFVDDFIGKLKLRKIATVPDGSSSDYGYGLELSYNGIAMTDINNSSIKVDSNGIVMEATTSAVASGGITVTANVGDITLNQRGVTHKLSEKADSIELERLKYYGDKDIVPSLESYFTVNTDGDTITGLTDEGKTQTELVIPYEINGKKIISITGSESQNNTSVKSIKLPNSITAIGNMAFFSYTALSSINIPNSVVKIEGLAFGECTSLKSIDISDSVTLIGRAAFNGSGLTSVKLPNSLTLIDTETFNNCSSLKSIDIPNGVNTISDDAFTNCTSLTSINIPNRVTGTGNGVFTGCTSLTIYCEQGSYAESYAKENSIPVIYTDIKSTTLDNKATTDEVVIKEDSNKMGINAYITFPYAFNADKNYVKLDSYGVLVNYEEMENFGTGKRPDITLVSGTTTHKLSEKVEAKTYTVSVPTTSWTEKTDTDNQKYYYKKITVSGMTASGQAMTDVAMSDSVATARKEMEAYQCINRVVTGDGYVELYCFEEAPTTAFTLRVLVISNVTNKEETISPLG